MQESNQENSIKVKNKPERRAAILQKLTVLKGELVVSGSLATILATGEIIVLNGMEQWKPGYIKELATKLPGELYQTLRQLLENQSLPDLNSIDPGKVVELALALVALGTVGLATLAISRYQKMSKAKLELTELGDE